MFETWLLRQTRRRDPIGDLARDWRDDPERTAARRHTLNHSYLDERQADVGAHDALTRARREWRRGL
jgi:hypothetical protein